jgi:GT2 family glycosyltransferase
MRITASLVLYHNQPEVFGVAISSFLDGCDGILYVVDNSASPLEHPLLASSRVHHIVPGRNLGFGAAHNVALERIGDYSDLHLILNPDVSFGINVLPYLIQRMASDQEIGVLMPAIFYPNGELQRLCKLLPSPADLILRRFIPWPIVRERLDRRYELHLLSQDESSDVPSLSGCFLLVRTNLLLQLGGFDERYFMYMEDVDLVRRIGNLARTVYEPAVAVTHYYAKGSYRNRKLLWYHIRSAWAYFNKWGWWFDPVRDVRNASALVNVGRPKGAIQRKC